MADRAVDVVVQIGGEDVPAGRLWSHRRRNLESATFSYRDDYLARPDAYPLDPALELASGAQQTPAGQALFGAFSDCAPDRWGRRLVARAGRRLAAREDRAERGIGEIDYLLGVRDDMRQGALRFRDPELGDYLADERGGVPPLVELPRLLNAAERLEREEASDDELQLLLRGGSSLGGARPKAHVLDQAGRPAIAKFPSSATDEWDVIRWEAVALRLAGTAGIEVAGFELHTVDGMPVLVVGRFDRAAGERIGYVSAMTMLEAVDGDSGSYLEVADAIERVSPRAGDDLRQLWRRIAFSILISNGDDHLRNHGFLRTTTAGWVLSPAFDLNPDPTPGGRSLSTAIDFGRYSADLGTLLEVSEHFRLTADAALPILEEVGAAVRGWRQAATELGIDGAAIGNMAPAFEHEQAERAVELTRR